MEGGEFPRQLVSRSRTIAEAEPTSAWQPPSAPEIEFLIIGDDSVQKLQLSVENLIVADGLNLIFGLQENCEGSQQILQWGAADQSHF